MIENSECNFYRRLVGDWCIYRRSTCIDDTITIMPDERNEYQKPKRWRLLTMFFVLPNIVYFNLVACDPPNANWPKEGRFNAQCHNILIYVFYDILPLFVKYQNLTAISVRILKSARTSADLNFRHQSFLPAISAFCLLANGPECWWCWFLYSKHKSLQSSCARTGLHRGTSRRYSEGQRTLGSLQSYWKRPFLGCCRDFLFGTTSMGFLIKLSARIVEE